MSAPAVIRFRNRETGALVTEQLFAERELRFLYEHPLGRALTDFLLRWETLNHVYGWVQRSRSSRSRIRDFVTRLGIDAAEAEKPLDAYASLDDFFTRRLRPGARPFEADPNRLPCPAEGRVLVFPTVSDQVFFIKGSPVTLVDLIGDPRLLPRYVHGSVVVIRLAPADYHRFHFPDDGWASAARRYGRGLHSVHPVALAAGAPAFRNKRTICRLASRSFGDLMLAEVGALVVGTIVQTYVEGEVRRGQEKGYFRFGGSTMVLVAEPGRVRWDDDLVTASAQGLESYVKVGTHIGCAAPRPQA